MKMLSLRVAALLLVFTGSVRAGTTPEIKYGFDAMLNLEQLPLLFPNGTQTRQPLAYDPTGENWDHHFLSAFSKNTETHRRPDGTVYQEYVIYDEYGPGVLYRQQMNAWFEGSARPDTWVPLGRLDQPRADANILYYFDDERQPRINMHLSDYFAAKTAPFTEPLAFIDPYIIFANSYYPLPYQKRLKITVRPNRPEFVEMDNKWYQYTALSFPVGTPIKTWEGLKADSPAVRALWAKSGENPHNLTGCQTLTGEHPIKAGETKTIFSLTQPGSIVGLKLKLTPYTKDTFFNTRLRIFWDDQQQPAVDLPLGYFFGGGGKDYPATAEKIMTQSLTSLFFGFNKDQGSFYSYWPMPFGRSARIEVANRSAVDLAPLACEVVFKPASVLSYPMERTGYFHAKRTVDSDPATIGYRGVAFHEKGRGHVVGILFYSDLYDMDGDEFTYIDDSRTPQIHGSGTEDDHNQGWAGKEYQKPLWGALINGYNAAYRVYLNDCYVFNRSILISYEYSLMKKERFVRGGNTDSTVFYYKAAGGPNLFLTDELDVGNHFSESTHRYAIAGQTWQGILKDEYDGYERNRLYGSATDEGRAFRGSSRFTATLAADNQGMLLRKRINRRGNGVQTAEVLIDGQKVGRPWHVVTPSITSGQGEMDGWFDTDFDVPASFTQGKRKVAVEIRYLGSPQKSEINEFYYWIYSYK